MLFKPTVIIFVQRSGLLIAGRHIKQAKLPLPDELVHNLEARDQSKLASSYREFFASQNLHGKRVIVVLDYSVVFEKAIKLDQSGQPDKLLEGFVAAMPFDVGHRACLGVENDAELRLFATNSILYETVVDALRASSVGSITAITPIAAYNLAEQERTVSAATERILKGTGIEKKANFQEVTPV